MNEPGLWHNAIKAFITKGEEYYVAECLEIAVVTQGKTLDETVENLREAVGLQRVRRRGFPAHREFRHGSWLDSMPDRVDERTPAGR